MNVFVNKKPGEVAAKFQFVKRALQEQLCRRGIAGVALQEQYCMSSIAGATLQEQYCRSSIAGAAMQEQHVAGAALQVLDPIRLCHFWIQYVCVISGSSLSLGNVLGE